MPNEPDEPAERKAVIDEALIGEIDGLKRELTAFQKDSDATDLLLKRAWDALGGEALGYRWGGPGNIVELAESVTKQLVEAKKKYRREGLEEAARWHDLHGEHYDAKAETLDVKNDLYGAFGCSTASLEHKKSADEFRRLAGQDPDEVQRDQQQGKTDDVRTERDQFAICLSLMGHGAMMLSNSYLDKNNKRQLTPGLLQDEEGVRAGWECLEFALEQCNPPNKEKLGYSVLHRCIEICGVWLPSQLNAQDPDEAACEEGLKDMGLEKVEQQETVPCQGCGADTPDEIGVAGLCWECSALLNATKEDRHKDEQGGEKER